MHPLLLCFADGRAFFAGLALTLSANLLLLRFGVGRWRGLLTVLAAAGMIFVALSATPAPLWLYAVWGSVSLTVLVLGNQPRTSQRLRFWAALTAAVVSGALIFMEAPYHRTPHITVKPGQTVYVLGDSLSAGMTTRDHCWPEALTELAPLRVINCAQAGATVQSAFAQAQKIITSNSVVILEIGGNDLLGGTDVATFRAQLDSLLRQLRAGGHMLVMFELPLYPFRNAYGQVQRELAARHGAILLPKRQLTRVLGRAGGTQDGLHLSDAGHAALAQQVADVIRPEK
ncbi:MAG: GDSL-type esterase/lipase family protein [Kiritimatiellaeota bacterium]|nr:GDSL-type esterase/lipase family protein [Kiritimatiellota bacterium]